MSYSSTEDLLNELEKAQASFKNTKKNNLNQGARTEPDLYPKTAIPDTYEAIDSAIKSIMSQDEFAELIKDVEDRLEIPENDKFSDDPLTWFYESDSPSAQAAREVTFSQLSEDLTAGNFTLGCDRGGTATYLSSKGITEKCGYNPCEPTTHTEESAKCAITQAALPGIRAGLESAASLIRERTNAGDLIDISQYARMDDRDAAIAALAEELYRPAQGRIKTEATMEGFRELAQKTLNDYDEKRKSVNEAIQKSPFGDVNVGFKEQCFFLAHLQTFMAFKTHMSQNTRTRFKKDLPTVVNDGAAGNRCMQLHGEPFGFINKLTQSESKKYFFDSIDAAALSNLQPMIRLYKVETDAAGNEYTVELNFNSYSAEITNSLSNKNSRGSGVGLKNFSFAYEATNPFGIKKTITAKLSLFANSFQELLTSRGGTGVYGDGKETTAYYQYTDLALKTTSQTFKKVKSNPQNSDVALRKYEKVNFRLKAVVGYAAPRTGVGNFDYNAIYNSFVTLNLTPTIHEFNIDDSGRVTFDINYLAYVEDFFDHPSFNIFSDPRITIEEMEKKFDHILKDQKCQGGQQSDEERAAEQKKIEANKLANFNALIGNLVEEAKIYQLDIKLNDLVKYQASGPLLDFDPELMKFLSDKYEGVATADDDIGVSAINPPENNDSSVETPSSDDKFTSNPIENIPFFWVSDLIDVILKYIGKNLKEINEFLEDKVVQAAEDRILTDEEQLYTIEALNYRTQLENFKRFRVLLGPMEVVNTSAKKGQPVSIISNLGDIPVSVKYFLEWMTNKVLKTNRQAYPLPVFLNQFFNNFIRDFLNNDTCFGNSAKQKVRIGEASISAYNNFSTKKYVDDIQFFTEQQGNKSLDITKMEQPILSVMGYRDDPRTIGYLDQETNYLAYYASRVQPVEKMQGNRSADNSRGIFHYLLGSDKGIIKNITLNKNNAPGLAELRFEQEGYDGLAQLMVLYDAGIKTYFDGSAFPGNYIYVEPKGFDPSLGYDITKLGIGGYFMIIKSEHSLGAGLAETNITAKWVAQVESEEEMTEQERANMLDCESRNAERKTSTSLTDFEQSLSGVPGLGFIGDLFEGSSSTTDTGDTGSESDAPGNEL